VAVAVAVVKVAVSMIAAVAVARAIVARGQLKNSREQPGMGSRGNGDEEG
jgi:hypothetical protein